ncbi:MAG: hypothetical protein HPY50_21970 [Firmicutes bacterium]|nr:hypothetical protein [Bacillota bacterium]
MRLYEIKKPYDVVIGLGATCQVAYQLGLNGLRSFRAPLDWILSYSTKDVIRLLRNRFDDFMQIKNIVIKEFIDPIYIVKEINYGFYLYHDLVRSSETEDFSMTYSLFKEKLNKYIIRFFSAIAQSDSILFVRSHTNPDESRELHSVLCEIADKKVNLLIVNYLDGYTLVEKNLGIDGICFVEIPDTKEWYGYSSFWQQILGGIRLIKEPELRDEPILPQ